MYTEPEIVSSQNPGTRCYIKVYIDGKRYRFYNGKSLAIHCNPNHMKSIRDRDKALTKLSYELKKKLETGWRPDDEIQVPKPTTKKNIAGECIRDIITEMNRKDLSDLYKRDISSVGEAFVRYLQMQKMYEKPLEKIDSLFVEGFLKQFNHSATYYMNKRRTLSAIFSGLVKNKIIVTNPLTETVRLKERATLHEAYTREQLHKVLQILEQEHPNLHLCALLMYGCFLRPHQEIRSLFRRNFASDLSAISLSGDDNKSGRVRTVFVPGYIREVLSGQGIISMDGNTNIFTGTCDVFNQSYFNTSWSRLKTGMIKEGIISENHTLYSFRHTAAINLYMKTKDLYKVQQAMGHSSMTVTLTYMRSLGLINNITPEDLPEL